MGLAIKMKAMSEDSKASLNGSTHYRSFLDKMSEGAVTIDRDGAILYCNLSFAAMTGQTAEAIEAQELASFVWEEDRRYFNHLLAQASNGELKGEVSLVGKKGYLPVQLSVYGGYEDGSQNIVITDLSNIKETQTLLRQKIQQLESSHRALELSNHDLQQFASVASHDLQEPL